MQAGAGHTEGGKHLLQFCVSAVEKERLLVFPRSTAGGGPQRSRALGVSIKDKNYQGDKKWEGGPGKGDMRRQRSRSNLLWLAGSDAEHTEHMA